MFFDIPRRIKENDILRMNSCSHLDPKEYASEEVDAECSD
jgi:hypothetical protein